MQPLRAVPRRVSPSRSSVKIGMLPGRHARGTTASRDFMQMSRTPICMLFHRHQMFTRHGQLVSHFFIPFLPSNGAQKRILRRLYMAGCYEKWLGHKLDRVLKRRTLTSAGQRHGGDHVCIGEARSMRFCGARESIVKQKPRLRRGFQSIVTDERSDFRCLPACGFTSS